MFVVTVPANNQGYTAKLEALDAGGNVMDSVKTDFVPLNPGADRHWNPTCQTSVSVAVDPVTVTRAFGETQQFIATVSGTSNTATTWSTNDPTGSITSAGFYTAGNTPGSYQVIARSVADPTKSGSATVQVQSATISISPISALVGYGATVQFTATVSGASNQGVTWSTTDPQGTVSASGRYTAGQTLGTYVVVATSVADPTKTASATVTVMPPIFNVCNAEGTFCTGQYTGLYCDSSLGSPPCTPNLSLLNWTLLSGVRNADQSFTVFFHNPANEKCKQVVTLAQASAVEVTFASEAQQYCLGKLSETIPGQITGKFTIATRRLVVQDARILRTYDLTLTQNP
jgi:hypothetical protein